MAEAKGSEASEATSESTENAGGPGGTPENSSGNVRWGNESKRFEQSSETNESSGEVPEGLPERFLKDGKPDYANLTKSYVELDKAFKTKTDELREQVKSEMFKDRPEDPSKYELPDIGENAPIDAESPLVEWWREQSHNMGLNNEGFQEGITKFIERVNALHDPEAEKAKLGENADERINAVSAWASKNFTDEGEVRAINMLLSTADGIKLAEKLAGMAGELQGDNTGDDTRDELTVEKLREMQNDPRYHDPRHRDPAFVKQVDDGYAKLYGGA